jgi:hypothetical protein
MPRGPLQLRRLESLTRPRPEGIQFFTRGKAITSRWLDPSHGGINLGFPENN